MILSISHPPEYIYLKKITKEIGKMQVLIPCFTVLSESRITASLPSCLPLKSIIMSPSAGLSTQTLIEAEIAVDAG